MGMKRYYEGNIRNLALPEADVLALLQHLADTRSGFQPAVIIGLAIREWIATQRSKTFDDGEARGYQWKQLFLPTGTKLRTKVAMVNHVAEVVGDEISWADRKGSPHDFANGFGVTGRNAWLAIWLLFPAERSWRHANECRPLAPGRLRFPTY